MNPDKPDSPHDPREGSGPCGHGSKGERARAGPKMRFKLALKATSQPNSALESLDVGLLGRERE